jgi:membrane protein YqaA with SNARE-associated domain
MSRKPDPLLCLVFFVAGALLPLPGFLVLAGLWVRGIQASVLLASLVALLAASSPWWVDWLEDRKADREIDESIAERSRLEAAVPLEDC